VQPVDLGRRQAAGLSARASAPPHPHRRRGGRRAPRQRRPHRRPRGGSGVVQTQRGHHVHAAPRPSRGAEFALGARL